MADFERGVKFYSTILGEEIQVAEHMGQKMGFFPMSEKEGVGGALVPAGNGNAPSKTGTRVYLTCEGKLDEVISKVEPAGGKITQPRMSIGEYGFIAFMEDTEGNIVGLHSSK